jgi:hypothetical protein
MVKKTKKKQKTKGKKALKEVRNGMTMMRDIGENTVELLGYNR